MAMDERARRILQEILVFVGKKPLRFHDVVKP